MENRIWDGNSAMTWSTITELLGEDDDVRERLKKLTLDLSDNLAIKEKQYKELEKQLNLIVKDIGIISSNLGACINFSQRKLCPDRDYLKYIHDKVHKTVKIAVGTDGIEVTEEHLTD